MIFLGAEQCCRYADEAEIAVDWEIFARKNICLLNFRVVLFSSPWHTGSVASFLLFEVEEYSCF